MPKDQTFQEGVIIFILKCSEGKIYKNQPLRENKSKITI